MAGEGTRTEPEPTTFGRDALTAAAYATLGCFAYLLYAIGPALPFLRTELRLSYTTTSLHAAAFSGGGLLAAMLSDRLTRRIGRHAAWTVGLVGMAAGAAMLAGVHRVGLTLAAVAVTGSFGGLLQVWVASVLSDRHGPFRDRALVEANVVASAAAVLAPLALAGGDRVGLGWRAGLSLPVLAAIVLTWTTRRVAVPAPPGGRVQVGARLPAAYWAGCAVVALVVAVEFCVVLWGASFLRAALDSPATAAAAAMSAFYLAELTGRLAGGRLTRVAGRGRRLLAGSLAVTAAGFLLFWLPRSFPVNVAGLFLTGLGVANLYPLAVALALGAAPGHTDAASARIAVAVGLAVLVAPVGLAAVADRVGVPAAFTVEVALLVATAGALRVAATLACRLEGSA